MSQKVRILVADDEVHVRKFLVDALVAQGYEVEEASDGRDALERFRKAPFDIVLTDLRMPRMDGLALLKAIHEEDPAVLVVVITGYGTVEDAVEAIQNGAFNFLSKPVSLDQLYQVVRKSIEHRRYLREKVEVLPYMSKELHFQIPSHRRFIPGIASSILRNLEDMRYPLSPAERFTIPLAIDEALLNAIEHGNKNDANKKVRVRCRITERWVEISVEDEGEGFDPSSIPDPTDPEHMTAIRGRGLFLIRNYMDEIRFNEKGNRITMLKYNRRAYLES
ncbi:MAG TPA: response regulator [Candidatus Latescibacteria bacterium]|nr:response regulator [Candidatus Latescibacterota bacterium]